MPCSYPGPTCGWGLDTRHEEPLVSTLSAGIEDLSSKRDELHKHILFKEEEKQRVQHDLHILTERLAAINEGLARKIAIRNDYDRTIAETEGAYKKVCVCMPVCLCSSSVPSPPTQILESSQSLLHVLKRESTSLKDKARTDQTSKPSSLHRAQ